MNFHLLPEIWKDKESFGPISEVLKMLINHRFKLNISGLKRKLKNRHSEVIYIEISYECP